MTIRLLAFGIAKDILESRAMPFDLTEQSSIRDLKRVLIRNYPGFRNLASLSFAVNESYVDDDYVLQQDDEVVLIPPVSGG